MLGDSSTTQLHIHTTTTSSSQSVEGGRVGGGPNIGQHEEEARRGEGGGGGGGGVDNISLEVGCERSFGGNRWPRQETLALLKIRSDMDVAFREASVKGPLWDEVSRKLTELGYNRSAKKCREKFENVYKYHKRTKEGRPGKSEGKTYRFFDQLEAFESQPSLLSPPPQPPPPQQVPTRVQTPVIIPATMPAGNINVSIPPGIGASNVTVPSVAPGPATLSFSIPSYQQGSKPNLQPPPPQQQQQQVQPIANVTDQPQTNIPSSNFQALSPDLASNSSSSSTSSDVEIQGRGKKKRKWKDFFERLMREVIQKQEEMQRRFLEAIEKREQERMHREESWRMKEIARVTKEREILAQERSMAATKDAAMMAFLQKLSEQQNLGQLQVIAAPSQPPAPARPPPPPQPAPILAPQLLQQQQLAVAAAATTTSATATTPLATATTMTTTIVPMQQQVAKSGELIFKSDNGDQNLMPPSSSRWPKVEVQALIKLRTSLDSKYQDNGPKGPLWEEISSGMRRLGYNRNAKRCKEKWENINKYFKKVKESNKQRPEDSKTCPYFHQLDALYKEKNKMFEGSSASNIQFRPENSVPLLVQPEQQWPPPPGQQEHRTNDAVMEDIESEDDDDDDDDVDDKDNEDEEEDEAGGYEIVANSKSKATPVSTGE